MKKPMPPCLDCPDRKPKCHSTCEKYITYQNDNREYQKLRAKERMINNVAKDKLYF